MTQAPQAGAADWASNRADQAPRTELLKRLADELVKATKELEAVEPLRDRVLDMTLDDAYQIQDLQLQQHLAAGATLAGRKVGLTSLAMQQQLGVDSPDFGYLLEDMVYEDNANIPADTFIAPKVEPEFGFKLNKTLTGPGVTREDAVAAIGEVYPAIEIIDSRIADWNIRLVDTVADNASCGAMVVGSTPLDVNVEELADVECSLLINDEKVGTGKGADVMGDPIAPLVWLANILGERGVSLEAGLLILPGSFTAAEAVVKDTSATADFGALGSLTVNFT